MLADAFAAERLRLSKAWGVLFWGFLFVPAAQVLLGLGQSLFMSFIARKQGIDPAKVGALSVDLGHHMVGALNLSGLFLVQLFFMIAAASILAGDYRWETWRLLTPRNTRVNLMLGKMATFATAAALGLVAIAVAGLIVGLLDAAIMGSPVGFGRDPGALPRVLAGAFVIGWLELMALAGVAAVLAVISRNGVAALLVPVALWVAQAMAIGAARTRWANPNDPPLGWLAGLPALCGDVLRGAVGGDAPAYAMPAGAPWALVFLLAWIVGLWALAIWLFKRQDLTRE